jgi:hypothetical protein
MEPKPTGHVPALNTSGEPTGRREEWHDTLAAMSRALRDDLLDRRAPPSRYIDRAEEALREYLRRQQRLVDAQG